MRTPSEIHAEIEQVSERRAELWQRLGVGLDSTATEELHALDARLPELWDEHRAAKAEARFGDRARIVARARAEERMERAA